MCVTLSFRGYVCAAPTDRQTEPCIQKNTNQSSGLVSETLSFSEGPGLRFMTRSGAMQAREPTPRASCVCGSSREGGGAILVPTQSTEQGTLYLCRHTTTPTLSQRCSGGKLHPPRQSINKVGPWVSARCTKHTRPAPPLPLCPSILPYVLHPDFWTELSRLPFLQSTMETHGDVMYVFFPCPQPAVLQLQLRHHPRSHAGPCASRNSQCHQPCPESGSPRMPRPAPRRARLIANPAAAQLACSLSAAQLAVDSIRPGQR